MSIARVRRCTSDVRDDVSRARLAARRADRERDAMRAATTTTPRRPQPRRRRDWRDGDHRLSSLSVSCRVLYEQPPSLLWMLLWSSVSLGLLLPSKPTMSTSSATTEKMTMSKGVGHNKLVRITYGSSIIFCQHYQKRTQSTLFL